MAKAATKSRGVSQEELDAIAQEWYWKDRREAVAKSREEARGNGTNVFRFPEHYKNRPPLDNPERRLEGLIF